MACYLLPIDNPENTYSLHVLRFNPETDEKARWVTYRVPHVPTMTVIEALEYLWDQGEYIAFRSNCREFTCGSCAMLINGKPRLACDTLLRDGMRLEPLSRYRVLRDLVVENSVAKDRLKELKYWPVREEGKTTFSVPLATMLDYGKIYSRCIECKSCLEVCPASSHEDSKFIGPMYALLLGRVAKHPLDSLDRINQASMECGIWACVSCYECADVCPVNLNPGKEVTKFRRRAISHAVLQRLGFKKGKSQ